MRVPAQNAPVTLMRMTDALSHRGPDGQGAFFDTAADGATIALGHRRLAIIDISGSGQPFIDPQSGLAMSYNGEVYNFAVLREELSGLGHCFRTSGDTEVVLAAYRQWGTDCFARLRGMFALAIWDPARQRLTLARDAFGKKPLFLRNLPEGLLFASEPKAILAYGASQPGLNADAVAAYLEWRYVPAPQTLFDGITKLMPGCWAEWDGHALTQARYYTPPYAEVARRTASGDPVGDFRQALDQAVALRMQSDVPFGAFLSGGLDSSAVVALMTRHASSKVRTFSVGFAEAEYSELSYARVVAERFGTEHVELTVAASDLMAHLPRLITASDGPVSEPSNIPIWLLATKASETVKMVLTGEGADELLAGYPKHAAERFGTLWRSLLPAPLRRHVLEPVLGLLPARHRRIRTMAASMDLADRTARLPRWFGALTRTQRRELMARPSEYPPPGGPLFVQAPGRSVLEQALLFDQASWLPDNLLERGDRMTMAASVEARMPFMDTALAAQLGGLGDRWRLHGFTGKYILREAMRGLLPDAIIDRPKVGFRVPVAQWFQGPMRGYLRDHLSGPGSLTRGLYAAGTLERILEQHECGAQNHEKLLWSLLNLELFQSQYRLGAV